MGLWIYRLRSAAGTTANVAIQEGNTAPHILKFLAITWR